jgi:hypothetical protein
LSKSIEGKQITIITTASGSIHGWKDSKLIWTREEALSETQASVVVELPERKVEETISVLDHEGLVARTIRHLQQLVVSGRGRCSAAK